MASPASKGDASLPRRDRIASLEEEVARLKASMGDGFWQDRERERKVAAANLNAERKSAAANLKSAVNAERKSAAANLKSAVNAERKVTAAERKEKKRLQQEIDKLRKEHALALNKERRLAKADLAQAARRLEQAHEHLEVVHERHRMQIDRYMHGFLRISDGLGDAQQTIRQVADHARLIQERPEGGYLAPVTQQRVIENANGAEDFEPQVLNMFYVSADTYEEIMKLIREQDLNAIRIIKIAAPADINTIKRELKARGDRELERKRGVKRSAEPDPEESEDGSTTAFFEHTANWTKADETLTWKEFLSVIRFVFDHAEAILLRARLAGITLENDSTDEKVGEAKHLADSYADEDPEVTGAETPETTPFTTPLAIANESLRRRARARSLF